MAGPYRPDEEPPLARYALRTSLAAYLPLLLGLPMVGASGWMFVRFGLRPSVIELVLPVVGVLLVAYALFGTRELRIGGRRGELRLFRDRVEVPRASGREPIVVPVDQLRLHVMQQVVRFMLFGVVPAGEMNRGFVVTLLYPGGSRALSDRVFVSRDHADRAVEDLKRITSGLPPLGPDARPDPPPYGDVERDDYDERIDDELRKL